MKQATNLKQIKNEFDDTEKTLTNKKKKDDRGVMNMEEYRKKSQIKDIESHLLKAEDDIRNGRVKDAREVFKKWKEQYGI